MDPYSIPREAAVSVLDSCQTLRTQRRPVHLAWAVLAVIGLFPVLSSGQLMPVVVETPGGTSEVWVALPDGSAHLVASGVGFLPIRLAGAPARERLCVDRIRERGQGTPAPHVALPGGGALYRVSMASGHTGLLFVNASGRPRLVFRALDVTGVPAIQEHVFVEPAGTWAVVSTVAASGGDVLRVPLGPGGPPINLTSATPALSIDALSLRSSAAATWFVSAGRLYRIPSPGVAFNVPFPKNEPWAIPELVLSGSGNSVAVVVMRSKSGNGAEDDKRQRDLFVVSAQGAVLEVGDGKADYEAPLYDHPRGPFLALSRDGSHAAYRKSENTHELFLRSLAPLGEETQITDAPTFYNYIDNVGVLGFLDETTLFFAAGDSIVSGQPVEAMIGAGEFFAGQLNGANDPALTNVTLTSGQPAPPFDTPGTVDAEEVVFSPSGEHLLIMGMQLDGPDVDTCALVSVAYGSNISGVTTQLSNLLDLPRLVPLGTRVAVISRFADPAGSGAVLKQLHIAEEAGGVISLRPVVTFSDALSLDRFVVDRLGRTAAFVATLAPGVEQPLVLDLASGMLTKLGPGPMVVSPSLAFSASGTLYLGLAGQPGAPYSFGWFAGPLDSGMLPLPSGFGFPLAH